MAYSVVNFTFTFLQVYYSIVLLTKYNNKEQSAELYSLQHVCLQNVSTTDGHLQAKVLYKHMTRVIYKYFVVVN